MNVERILVIRFSSLGDIILLTPLFREIKKQFTNAKLDFLTTTTFDSVCENNPHLDSIISFERSNESAEIARITSLLKRNKYDLILDAHNSLRSRIILIRAFGFFYWLNSSIKSIDKRSWKRNLLLSFKINLLKQAISQKEAYCRLITRDQKNIPADCSSELFPSKQDQERVKVILHDFNFEGKTIVALGPGASFAGKCWPKEYYLELAQRFHKKDVSVLLLGGDKDQEPVWVEQNSQSPVLNMAGKLSYLETAAILQKCKLAISNDSAIVHFSEAVGTPAIAIFGPTVKEFGYAPFLKNSQLIDLSLSCRPCSRNGKGACRNLINRQCLVEIPVDRVFENAIKILNL